MGDGRAAGKESAKAGNGMLNENKMRFGVFGVPFSPSSPSSSRLCLRLALKGMLLLLLLLLSCYCSSHCLCISIY
jgi:hypothetical protein